MKKISLLLIVVTLIAVMAFTLTACNSATTQGQLENILSEHNHEVFDYDVLQDGSSVGTYTVTLNKVAAGSTLTYSDSTFYDVLEGINVESELIVGTTKYNLGCYYALINGSSFMVPTYTYRLETVNGQEKFKLTGVYDGATLDYNMYINGGDKISSSLKCETTPYYDNNEFHQLLRGITTFSTSFSFTYGIPLVSASEQTSVSLTATCTSTETVTSDYNSDGIECYKVELSRSTQVAGTTQQLYYAVDDVKSNGWPVTHALIKIVEGNITYSLKSISIA